MTRKRTPEQNRQLHRLIGVLGINEEEKAELVSSFTFGRETSSKNMLEEEARQLIAWLKDQDEDKHGQSRKTIWHYLLLLNWSSEKIEGWAKKHGGKKLNDLGGGKLNNLVTQAKNIYKKEIKAKISK